MTKTKVIIAVLVSAAILVLIIGGMLWVKNAVSDPLSDLETAEMEFIFSDIASRAHVMGIKENGVFYIPDEYRMYFKMDTAVLCEYNGGSAIYFQTFGFLDESRGYLFVTDGIDYKDYINTEKYTASLDIIEREQLTDCIYKIRT